MFIIENRINKVVIVNVVSLALEKRRYFSRFCSKVCSVWKQWSPQFNL